MDSSKLCEEAEECHSSESGWTMYIGSPINDDDDGDGDTNDDDGYADGGDGKDDHSDDSMTSDASSGPSLQGSLYGDVIKDHDGHAISHFKHDHVKGYDFQKKTDERPFMEKQKGGLGMRKKEEKEGRSFKTKRSSNAATSQSGNKVGKSLWLGRRK